MAAIGSVLGGRYRLIELVGQGGMATIYQARDNQLERDVAVKVLRPEYGRDPEFLARFRQEAQSAASLNHPNVVAVYDYGTDEAGPYIVMELVDGEDLATIIRRSGALPSRQAAALTAAIARAIAAAHAEGIVHRDVKPGNVLVTRDGRIKVTDFGIARAVAEAQVTLPGTTLGSVHYFSPEQARGEPTTAASDIYSLGIVLFELLTGRRPWEGDSAASIAMARLTGPTPSPSSIQSGIPPALDAIDREALARDPAERFETAAAMAAALDAFLASDRAAGAAAGVGLAAAAAFAGPPTVVSGVAHANPPRVPNAPDGYVGADDAAPVRPVGAGRRAPVVEPPDDDGGGVSPWVWISALLALALVAVVGFLVFRPSAGGSTPPVEQVTVPNFVDLTYDQADSKAKELGIVVVRFEFQVSDKALDTVLGQDPAAGVTIDKGGQVKLTLALGAQPATVPDLRGKSESEALNLIITAGLTIGQRTDAFDPSIPLGSVVSQNPGAGLVVTKGLVVNYVVSKGPELSPSPSAIATNLRSTGSTKAAGGAPITLSATLKTRSGTAISGETVTFTLNGVTLMATTNASGVASVQTPAPDAHGSYPITVTFAGDATYSPSSTRATLRVK